jgi:hypothetical protein
VKATLTNDERIKWLEKWCEKDPFILKQDLFYLVDSGIFLGDAIDMLYEELGDVDNLQQENK